MAKYRIMTFDGGGILGLLIAVQLERLTKAFPNLLAQVDMFAGTSTGGLIALGLARGLSPTELRSVYEENGKEIFDDSWLDNIKDIGQLRGSQYDNVKLAKEIKSILGENTKLKELPRKVLIPSFDLDNEVADQARRTWKPKFFHNFNTKDKKDNDGEELAYKIGLYTSAAPTYFPSVDGYIDGGVIANNPSMAALAQSQDERILFPKGERPALSDIVLLSFSCGKAMTYVKGKNLDWGFAQWAQPLVQIMLNGGVAVADYQCRQLLRDNYRRVDPIFPAKQTFTLDDTKRIPALADFSESTDLIDTTRWIKEHW